MVRHSGHRGDNDHGAVTDRTGRIEGCTITASSRGLRGRHSTSDLPSTLNPLPACFHYDTGALRSSTQPPPIPFRSRPPLPSHPSYTHLPYEPYGSAHPPSHLQIVYDPYLHAPIVRPHIPYRSVALEPIQEFNSQPRQIGVELFYQIVGAAPQDFLYGTYGHIATAYGVSSSECYIGRHSTDKGFEGDRDERVDDNGDGDDDNQDDGENAGDEEQPVLVAPARGSDRWPRHGQGKGCPAVLCQS
ncbi:hypothetical protein M9H77_12502 [Catharanthus roseus]|uniref:Uncharacterized protein n=1 Tax=Catharanthus roseus TaxID=4058 RepID=A0ACC0BHQ8_CATRO|nr:hypothetical protein M9H77_12502 [Catharanthus roseus]